MPELVALDLPGGTGFVDALRAVWDTGDAAAVVDPRLPAEARATYLAALRPTRLVASDGAVHRLRDGVGVEDGDALVVATSGSTAEPRAAILTHDAIAASARATSRRLGIDPARHCWLACLPLAHIGGLSVVTRALITDTPVTVLPRFDADAVTALGESGAVSHVSLVATGLGRIDPSLFERILLGGARPPDQLAPNVVATYGMTETGSGVVYDGDPLDDVEIAIDHFEDGSGDGEILLRCPMLLRCYRGGEDGRVFGPDRSRTWFATGDAGYVTDEGTLGVRGRIHDVIVTGGEKVWPDAVERVLAAHSGVKEVAVWKRPDPEWGERVVAFIVPENLPLDTSELVDLVKTTLPPWAAPKEFEMVNQLPRTASGKLRRHQLR